MLRTWNIRDSTTNELQHKIEEEYKTIIRYDRFIKQAANVEDAKKLVEEKYRHKDFVKEIDLELMRRRINDEKTF